jgi:hypothetical protein
VLVNVFISVASPGPGITALSVWLLALILLVCLVLLSYLAILHREAGAREAAAAWGARLCAANMALAGSFAIAYTAVILCFAQ